MLNLWWVWGLAGLVLAGLELLVPGYIFLGFAIGAILTAGLVALELLGATTTFTLVVFALLSGLAWAGLRRIFGAPARDVKIIRHDINEDRP